MSVPFQGETFDSGYASIHKSGPSYIGLLDSAMMCVAPLQYTQYFDQYDYVVKSNPEYFCDLKAMGYPYENWDTIWYSPVCREWFQLQQTNNNQTTITDLYVYADGFEGLTMCGPMNDYNKLDPFIGA